MIQARGLNAQFPGREVLTGLDLDIPSGHVTAILGPNGAGKSTLLRCLAGLHPLAAGEVLCEGANLLNLSRRERAKRVSYLAQVAVPDWPFTVREYVELGRIPHLRWWQSLAPYDLAPVLNSLGLNGFESRLVQQLSGGEWQRVRLAQAMVQEPRVLLLDEPTTHLDPRYQIELLEYLRHLAHERHLAIAVTLHDLNLVGPWADRAVLMSAGRILAVGEVADVLTTPMLEQAYGLRLPVAPHPITATTSVALMRS
ncbi:MAG: ABC transporter ATP-binding protein [Fimbriiglobus sp.]